jgi:hypothetical protein
MTKGHFEFRCCDEHHRLLYEAFISCQQKKEERIIVNKMYTALKAGMERSMLKTLSVAKKLADTMVAEAFSRGKCVYKGAQQARVTEEPVVAQNPVQPEEERVETSRYRLKTLMNVRKHPTLDSAIVAIKPAGTGSVSCRSKMT